MFLLLLWCCHFLGFVFSEKDSGDSSTLFAAVVMRFSKSAVFSASFFSVANSLISCFMI